jgi:hypothetical protein
VPVKKENRTSGSSRKKEQDICSQDICSRLKPWARYLAVPFEKKKSKRTVPTRKRGKTAVPCLKPLARQLFPVYKRAKG